ncbi:MAG TPA: squalene/phytoene synthase family protein, partial [Woeseiaceae bacterium]|nr:squalene/phytoene synthase family protein [Woeseiaceae bacterium]
MPIDRLDRDGLALAACQDALLPGVSRTFALTIPQLPDPLRTVVTNAYLLCRIADTIEDDAHIGHVRKGELQALFLGVVDGKSDANAFAASCLACLSDRTPGAERRLIEHSPEVVALTHRLSRVQRHAIERCLTTMSGGMSHFARCGGLHGLSTMADLDRYCYVVAGCVGEMLTELFCDYLPAIAGKQALMMPLARSFGQGLQMTNILKDVWDDRGHNACWLPRDLFARRGIDLSTLPASRDTPAFAEGISELVGIARDHLRAALRYTQ